MPKLSSICKAPNCSRADRVNRRTGYCNLHHTRLLRTGTIADPVRSIRVCKVRGCERVHHAHGYCRLHGDRFVKHGTTRSIAILPDTSGETWRPVIGYEGLYEVSNRGRVQRVAGGRGVKPTATVARQCVSGNRMLAHLTKAGVQKSHLVHRLVALAFLGEPEPGRDQVNHKDGNPSNNDLTNLEWVSREENVQHAVIHGLYPMGEDNPAATLSEEIVYAVRRAAGTESQRALARRFGVSQTTIGRIIRRENWRHLP